MGPVPEIDQASAALPLVVGVLVVAGIVSVGWLAWLRRYLDAGPGDRPDGDNRDGGSRPPGD